MTFREYLLSQPVTQSTLGDFVDDVRIDAKFPDIQSDVQLSDYLRLRGACDEAFKAGARWWKRFCRSYPNSAGGPCYLSSSLARAFTTELYRHFDSAGRLLYVGISLLTVQRLVQHRAKSGWFPDIAKIEIQRFPTREAALQAESVAIRCERPLFNIAGAGDIL